MKIELNRKQINMLNKIGGNSILVVKQDESQRVYWIKYKNHKPIKILADYDVFIFLYSQDLLTVNTRLPMVDNESEIILNWGKIQELDLEKYIK